LMDIVVAPEPVAIKLRIGYIDSQTNIKW